MVVKLQSSTLVGHLNARFVSGVRRTTSSLTDSQEEVESTVHISDIEGTRGRLLLVHTQIKFTSTSPSHDLIQKTVTSADRRSYN